MFNKIALIALIALMLPAAAFATSITVQTNTWESQGIVDKYDVPLFGTTEGFDSLGCSIEVIKIGPGGPHPPDKYGNPTGGDQKLYVTFIGDGYPFPDLEPCRGRFATTTPFDANPNDVLIVRAWNSTEVSSSTYYGDSATREVPNIGTWDWKLKDDGDFSPAVKTGISFDNIPPDPPGNFIATPDASGDLILTWTKSSSPDAIGTRLVWRTDRYPTMEWDGSFTNVLTTAAQAYRHTGLTQGTTYKYGAFTYDISGNFSTPAATTSEVSNDTTPPSVIGWSPQGTSVDPGTTKIMIAFNDSMNNASVEAAMKGFTFSPFNWSADNRTVTGEIIGSLSSGTYYRVTVETTAADKAFNQLASLFTWEFRTSAGKPPTISDLKIDGWKQFPGDVISPHPKISATITDEDSGYYGVATVEMQADGFLYSYTTPELNSVYNRTNGYFDARFPALLPSGTYTVILRAFDVNGNSTEESVAGLKVSGGAVEVINKDVYAYPSEFESGMGTILSYKLNVTSDVQIYVYSAGGLVFKKKIAAGETGGIAGYNEVAWDGLSSLGNKLSNGLYVVIIANGDKRLAKLYVKINNPPER